MKRYFILVFVLLVFSVVLNVVNLLLDDDKFDNKNKIEFNFVVKKIWEFYFIIK